MKETDILPIAAQNNAIRTNHIKARIDKTQQNSKCRLCGDRDETIYHIISECSKLARKEYKSRHDWVGKIIHWELCKKFQFDHTNKWYIPSPHISPREWYTQTPLGFWHPNLSFNLGQTTRPYQQKREQQSSKFCCPRWPQSKIKRKWKEG